jgi:hypothetical protein
MKALFSSRHHRTAPWQQRGVEVLRQALRYLQGLLMVKRTPQVLALVPIRAVQPPVSRRRHARGWRD